MIELDMESLLAEDDLVVDQAQISPNLSKMTALKSEEKSSEFKKYVKGHSLHQIDQNYSNTSMH